MRLSSLLTDTPQPPFSHYGVSYDIGGVVLMRCLWSGPVGSKVRSAASGVCDRELTASWSIGDVSHGGCAEDRRHSLMFLRAWLAGDKQTCEARAIYVREFGRERGGGGGLICAQRSAILAGEIEMTKPTCGKEQSTSQSRVRR